MVHFLVRMAYRATERTEARRLAARERIVAAAHDLIAAGGYREASVAAVAGRAGVATGTVYRHFPSKAELFAEVFRRASQREVDTVAAALRAGGVAAAVETFARRALRGRRLAWALLAEPVDPAVEAERLVFRRAFRDAFAAALDGPDRDLVAAALVGAIGEALVGPLGTACDEEALVAGLVAFCRNATGGPASGGQRPVSYPSAAAGPPSPPLATSEEPVPC